MTRAIVLAMAALLIVAMVLAGAISGALTDLAGDGGQAPTVPALEGIPPAYLALYEDAARRCPGLPWSVLAAIGAVESDHGRSTAPGVHSDANLAGAAGPMQLGIRIGPAVMPSGGSRSTAMVLA